MFFGEGPKWVLEGQMGQLIISHKIVYSNKNGPKQHSTKVCFFYYVFLTLVRHSGIR